MITDEKRKAFEQWYMAQFGDKDMQTTESGNYFYVRHAAAWEAWQAAQQVKPLQFERDEDGDLVAKSPMGNFHVLRMVLSGFVYNGKPYKTEAEAIAAANEDYQRRALSCLVRGGE